MVQFIFLFHENKMEGERRKGFFEKLNTGGKKIFANRLYGLGLSVIYRDLGSIC